MRAGAGRVGVEPEDPCPAQPVEPGDGVVSDDDQGIAVGEPNPGAPTEPGTEPEPLPEGEPEPERVDPEQVDPATVEDAQRDPGMIADEGVICSFAVPVSAPATDGVLESAAGGVTSAGGEAAAGQLPRTGPYDRVLATAALGAALLLAGAGAVAAGRRRTA